MPESVFPGGKQIVPYPVRNNQENEYIQRSQATNQFTENFGASLLPHTVVNINVFGSPQYQPNDSGFLNAQGCYQEKGEMPHGRKAIAPNMSSGVQPQSHFYGESFVENIGEVATGVPSSSMGNSAAALALQSIGILQNFEGNALNNLNSGSVSPRHLQNDVFTQPPPPQQWSGNESGGQPHRRSSSEFKGPPVGSYGVAAARQQENNGYSLNSGGGTNSEFRNLRYVPVNQIPGGRMGEASMSGMSNKSYTPASNQTTLNSSLAVEGSNYSTAQNLNNPPTYGANYTTDNVPNTVQLNRPAEYNQPTTWTPQAPVINTCYESPRRLSTEGTNGSQQGSLHLRSMSQLVENNSRTYHQPDMGQTNMRHPWHQPYADSREYQ